MQGSKPYFYLVNMKGLKWTQSAFSTSFILSLSDIFSYARPDPNNTAQYVITDGTKTSEKIEVSNTPDIIQVKFLFIF